jgi:hypothetical protein
MVQSAAPATQLPEADAGLKLGPDVMVFQAPA